MIDRDYNPYFLNDFLDYLDGVLNKSSNTIKEYNYDLVNFFKYLRSNNINNSEENIVINDITIEELKKIELRDLHTYIAYLRTEKNDEPATRARKASALRTFFNYMTVKANLLEINPAQNLESPKIGKRLPKYLTLEESKNLLNVAKNEEVKYKERNYAIITLFLNCGMRLSELVGINLNHIDFKNEKLTVLGKGNKERTIYLNNACINAVEAYLNVRPKEGIKFNDKNALFISDRKERISQRMVQEIVKSYLTRAGLDKYSTHKLRHTAATLMYQHGNVDIRALQELLGHESISTTEIYTHVNNNQIRNAVDSNPLADETFE